MNKSIARWLQYAVIFVLCAGCAELRLISDYDEFTDQTVTSLQRQVETLLTTLERSQTAPACTYGQHEKAYLAMDVDLNLLISRNKPRARNDITNKQLKLLDSSLSDMEALHKMQGTDTCLGAADITLLRSAFESSFTAIVMLENAKRRGEEPVK